MAFMYGNVMMTATIEDSINDFCSPYCNPERNQLGLCPTSCIPFCYPICNRPFLHSIPPISPDVVIKKTDQQQTRDAQTGNGYPSVFPLFFLSMIFIGFLIFLCYAISKFAKSCSESSLEEAEEPENDPPVSLHSQELETQVDNPNGLCESVINSITVFKFKKDGGLVEGTNCSVCLSIFQENEALKLLPNCDHAFHVACIDTWLKSHKNCPMCRADIASLPASHCPSSAQEQQNNGGAETETEELELTKLE